MKLKSLGMNQLGFC